MGLHHALKLIRRGRQPLAAMLRAPGRSCWLTLILLGLALQPARADIDIQISGVEGELRRNVLAYLSLERYKARDDLDANLVERLQERAEREAAAALKPFGYYDAFATSTLEQLDSSRWRARIEIKLGEPVILREVKLEVLGPGEEHPAFRDILEKNPLRVGARLDHASYDTLKDSLRRTAATLGYVEAKLTVSELRVDPPNRSATVHLRIETGPRYSFGSTTIEQRSLDESLLRRYLRFNEQQPYDATQLLRTQFALDDSQYFSTVEVLAGEPDSNTLLIPVNIRTEANRRNRYAAGVGYATDSRARGTLTWENRRLNNRGHRSRVELKAAQIEQSFAARYVVPIGDPALEKFDTEWRYSRDELGDLDTRTSRLQPSITRVRGDWQQVYFTSLNRLRTITADTGRGSVLDTSTTLVIPGFSLASVPRGYLGEALFSRALIAEIRGSSTALGAEEDYVQLKVEAERVFDFSPKWHLFLRGQVGTTWISATDKLPGTERFFAGGDRSVRGFGYNDLSPLDEAGAKIGGRHLLSGTVEIIRDLPRNFSAAAFFDFGNAFDDFGDPLQHAAGIGLRLRLPVVTLGIDVAQPLTNPRCKNARPDPRCISQPGFADRGDPRLHLNFSPKL